MAAATRGCFLGSIRRSSLPRTWRGRPRGFWLDGEGRSETGERCSYIGWAGPEEPSLTFDAYSRTVLEHSAGRVRVVGDDIFEVLDERLARERGRGRNCPSDSAEDGLATSATHVG